MAHPVAAIATVAYSMGTAALFVGMLQTLPIGPEGQPLPTTYFLLFAALVVTMMGTFAWMIRRVVAAQDRIVQRLDTMAVAQGKEAQTLELISNKMLDALIVPGSTVQRAQVTIEKRD